MVQVLRGAQAPNKVVAVAAVVLRALDLRQVRDLVDVGRRLVLGVARPGQGRQRREVQVAVDHEAAAGQRVGQHARRARAQHVGAVVAGDAARRRAALGRDPAKDARDGAADAARRRLEVLAQLRRRPGRRGLLRRRGERLAVAQRRLRHRQLAAGAVALHAGALLVERDAARRGCLAVDRDRDCVGLERHRADQLGRVLLGKGKGARRLHVVLAPHGQVVGLGNVKRHLDGLARGDALEGVLVQVRGGDALPDAVKGDGVL